MRVLRALGRAWDQVELFIGGLFLSLSVLLVVGEILSRHLLSYSMVGSDEIAAYAVIWSVFFTASMAVKKNIHVRIDVIFTIIPPSLAKYVDAIGTAFSILFTAYLTWSGLALVEESWILGEVTMTMLHLPLWIPHLIVPIGGFLLTVRLAQRLVSLLTTPAEGIAPAVLADNHSI
ncbi:TRAP transporter small permease [Microvirga sp. M2]|uniref:TRAP transporter small permease n=1 Tax=Microvirga sp. M2 TaxID=3073270 RepID=UPI0039C4D79B